MAYYHRVVLFSVLLGVLIVAAIGLATSRGAGAALPPPAARVAAPRCSDGSDTLTVIQQTPNGRDVPRDSAIVVTFSCPADQRAVEHAFTLYPPAQGVFIWQSQTLTFQPDEPLRAQTSYRVTLFGDLVDMRGYMDGRRVSWPFITAP